MCVGLRTSAYVTRGSACRYETGLLRACNGLAGVVTLDNVESMTVVWKRCRRKAPRLRAGMIRLRNELVSPNGRPTPDKAQSIAFILSG